MGSSQNHRMAWVAHQPPRFIAAQAAQGPIQPGPEHPQGRSIHKLSGQPVPAPQHPLGKELLPDSQPKSSLLPFQTDSTWPAVIYPCKQLTPQETRIPLAFRAARARCWLTFCFSSTRTPRPFSAGQLSRAAPPRPYTCPQCLWPKCKTLHFAVLNLNGSFNEGAQYKAQQKGRKKERSFR